MAVPSSGRVVIGIAAVWLVLGVVVAVAAPNLPGPPDNYLEWTKQLFAVLGAAIGAKVIWEVPKTLQAWANRHNSTGANRNNPTK